MQQARDIEAHLRQSLETGALCSNDPVCAEHVPGDGMEGRWLYGAACHGCALIAEPSCEMRNEYLDRALVVPTLQGRDAAFFSMPVGDVRWAPLVDIPLTRILGCDSSLGMTFQTTLYAAMHHG